MKVWLCVIWIVIGCPIVWAQDGVAPAPKTAEPAGGSSSAPAPVTLPNNARLLIPVDGVKPAALVDTFYAGRSAGRTHNAIDIMAPRNTPVLAAADGEIVRMVSNSLGGITIYQLSADRQVVFYYAHLERYDEDLKVGQKVRQGDVLAYVGDTGNVTPGNTHLHFALWLVSDPKKYWSGTNLNPYPLLRRARPKP